MFSIQPATLGDLASLLDIETRCFATDRITQAQFIQYLSDEASQVMVCRHSLSNEITAYLVAFTRPRKSARYARVYSIATKPEWHGYGMAKALWQYLIESCRKRGIGHIGLQVNCSNPAAIGLYTHLGFELIRTLHAYYEDGADAYYMRAAAN